MFDFAKYTTNIQVSVTDAIALINANGKKVIFILDDDKKLLGIFTDGDMRKYILRKGNLNASIKEAMNVSPIVFSKCCSNLSDIVKKNKLIVYPFVDEEGRLVDAVFWDEVFPESDENCFEQLPDSVETVIMAGGLGTRLYPYTKVLPKPLIPIGDLPICTHVMNSFNKFGCKSFHLILNHKKNMIKAYYSEECLDYSIQFHTEKNFLGTAGGLFLLKDIVKNTFFLSNCDILVDTDYTCVYKYHKAQKNKITVIGALKNVQIPYGVINVSGDKEDSSIVSLEEKPKFSFLTNTGIYVVEPEVLDLIEDGEIVHMPDLILRFMNKGEKVGVFPVSGENWLDMGQIEEMKQMINVIENQVKK